MQKFPRLDEVQGNDYIPGPLIWEVEMELEKNSDAVWRSSGADNIVVVYSARTGGEPQTYRCDVVMLIKAQPVTISGGPFRSPDLAKEWADAWCASKID